jgi:hypothetical protein
MDEKKLLLLKQDIDDTKLRVTKLEARRDHFLEELKKKFKCSTIKEAKEKLAKLEIEIDKINQKIEEGLNELEEQYESINIQDSTRTSQRRTR